MYKKSPCKHDFCRKCISQQNKKLFLPSSTVLLFQFSRCGFWTSSLSFWLEMQILRPYPALGNRNSRAGSGSPHSASPSDDSDACSSLETIVFNPNQDQGQEELFSYVITEEATLGDLKISNMTVKFSLDGCFVWIDRQLMTIFSLIYSFNKYFLNAYSVSSRKVTVSKTEKSSASQNTILGKIFYTYEYFRWKAVGG